MKRYPRKSSQSLQMVRSALVLMCVLLLAACVGSSLKHQVIRHEPSFAKPPAQKGLLSDLADGVIREHGADASGFRLLDRSDDSLAARLALIDSTVSSLDIQTYLWYPDNFGKLMLQHAIKAADRGVYTRLIVDDLLTIGHDQLIYELDRFPNVEVRLFNPWKDRSTLARGGQFIAEMERLNTRMHDKLLIADGNAVVIGGRNIGDHYFGLSHDYNFHDLDVLGFGHIGRQANEMFDHFWNSDWVLSADNLDVEPNPEYARLSRVKLQEQVQNAEDLLALGIEERDWHAEAARLAKELHIGISRIVYDETGDQGISQNLAAGLFNFMGQAQRELLITNAYIIPGQQAINFIRGLTERGVKVRILTNSLASHDVPAVNSHYKKWRDDLINSGAELYELRADAAIKSLVDIPPVEGGFVGLHTKAIVIDREQVFIGSMNFDPRSANINTEAGAVVHSPGLAEELAHVMERDMLPENAWQVLLDENGKPYWVNSDETVYRQPARNGSQRIMDQVFKIVPKEQY